MNKKYRKLLYRSFDGNLSEDEKEVLENALLKSKELQAEKEKIALLRNKLSESTTDSFRPFFAERVASRINTLAKANNLQPDFFSSLVTVFRRVAISAAIVFALLLSANLIEGKFHSFEKNVSSSEMSLDDVLATTFTPSLEDVL
ncbi:MAG: hypothetical protein GXO75_19830 [Calditrichaeota bacterium]|nr:hypothetical protein [Calditrichota bacterium]